MADTVATLGFAVESSGLDQATQKLGQVTASAKQTSAAVNDLDRAFGPLNKDVQQLNQSFGPVVGGFQAYTKSVEAAANAHAGYSTQSMAAFHSVRSLTEAVVAGQSPIQALAQQFNHLSYAASGPGGLTAAFTPIIRMFGPAGAFIGITAGLGAFTFVFSKLGDEVYRSQRLFEGLTGSASSGKAALEAARAAARGAGFELDTMANGLQRAADGQAAFASKSVIYANSSDKTAKDISHLSEAFGTLGKIMQQAGATGKEETAVFDAIGSSIQKTGGLSADAFAKIRENSQITALRISQAFGYKTIQEFQEQIEKTPVSLEELLRVLDLIKPKVDAIKWDPTIEQQIRELSSAWSELVQKFGENGGFKAAKDVLTAIGTTINTDTQDILRLSAAISTLGQQASNVLSRIGTAANGQGTALNNTDPMGAANPYGDIQLSPSSPFDESGFAGAFASGGSFVVGGAGGGTDSQMVSFKATPGEIVTIATPDQAASGIASLTSVSGGPDIEELLKSQTKQIVEAINGLKTTSPSATSATLPVTLVGASSGGGVPAFGSGTSGTSGGGGGGGGSATPFKDLENRLKQEQAVRDAREQQLGGGGNFGGGGGFSGMVGGQAVPIRGFGGSRGGSFPTRAPTGPFGGRGYSINGADFNGSGGFDESGFTETYGTPDYYSGGGLTDGSLYGGNSGTFDYTPFDQSQMGSSSFDESGFAGSFAKGGSFMVGGDGGTDTTPIRMLATKGERVTITPPPSGIKVPSSMTRPGANDTPAPRPVQHFSKKEVTINVQAGISADTFIRSRAQVARGM